MSLVLKDYLSETPSTQLDEADLLVQRLITRTKDGISGPHEGQSGKASDGK